MKLRREDVAATRARHELDGIARRRRDDRRIRRLDIVRIHEVHAHTWREAFEMRRTPLDVELVPSHVRNLERMVARLEPAHAAGKDAETFDAPELVALLEQDLHADADSEERPVRR